MKTEWGTGEINCWVLISGWAAGVQANWQQQAGGASARHTNTEGDDVRKDRGYVSFHLKSIYVSLTYASVPPTEDSRRDVRAPREHCDYDSREMRGQFLCSVMWSFWWRLHLITAGWAMLYIHNVHCVFILCVVYSYCFFSYCFVYYTVDCVF